MLSDRVALIVQYLDAVSRGQARRDDETLRMIASLAGTLPSADAKTMPAMESASGGEVAMGSKEGESESGPKGELELEFMTVRNCGWRSSSHEPGEWRRLTPWRNAQEYNDVLLTTYLSALTKQLETANAVRPLPRPLWRRRVDVALLFVLLRVTAARQATPCCLRTGIRQGRRRTRRTWRRRRRRRTPPSRCLRLIAFRAPALLTNACLRFSLRDPMQFTARLVVILSPVTSCCMDLSRPGFLQIAPGFDSTKETSSLARVPLMMRSSGERVRHEEVGLSGVSRNAQV